MLTERLARLESGLLSPDELAQAIEVARHVRTDYDRYVSHLIALRESASMEVARWRADETNTAAAENIAVWTRRENEAAYALERCEVGRRRIDDALAQLFSLAERSR